LLTALKEWGALGRQPHIHRPGSRERRGFAIDPGGGLNSVAIAGQTHRMGDLLKSA